MHIHSELLREKICFVTGAARGLGRSISEHYAEEGAIVFVNARKEGCIDGWAEKLSVENSTKIIPVYFDITDITKLRKCFELIYKTYRKLDVLVNNAGVTSNELIGMIREDTILKLFKTNVFAGIQALQFAARLMKKQKGGSIINISSIIGVEGSKGELAYSGTKGAMIAITKSAAKELAPYGIRVNSVAPGYTDTDMFNNAAGSAENVAKHIKNIGLGRLARPDDIAEACVFLASDRSSYITGQILGVNGSTVI